MKKLIIIGSFALSISMISCGGSNESTETLSDEEKTEILELEAETKKLEKKKEDIDSSTKELEELLEEL